MARRYDHKAIEEKWQKRWKESKIYQAGARDESKEKQFILVEYPYPSGNLHIGHWYAFAVPDIYVRALRMQGHQVIFPIGFDSFGLPAENAAIKRKLDPREWTYDNISFMTKQLESMGNAFDWSRMVITSNPEYYRWTQWIFTQAFKNDLAYRGVGIVNWCPSCNTVLANEQVIDGTCERCGSKVELREMPEWKMRITKYADRLIDDLDPLPWPEFIKDLQRNWIGRKEGVEIDFEISFDADPKLNVSLGTDSKKAHVTAFTTRPDTLFGATALVLAPEHPFVSALLDTDNAVENKVEVRAYVEAATKKTEQERTDAKEKTGARLKGVSAINPASGERIPVFVADYVLARYGTGAIMAVPAHDDRDYAFALHHEVSSRSVIAKEMITHAGALLELKAKPGTFLFQLRSKDAKRLPGKIGLFGGTLEEGEAIHDGFIRELSEELELKIEESDIKNTYTYTGNENAYVWVGHIQNVEKESLVLHEGDKIVELTLEEAKNHPDIAPNLGLFIQKLIDKEAYETAEGILHSSGEFDGRTSEEAWEKITMKVKGRKTSTYRLRDWSVGRQRYWGVPIPIVYDPSGNPHAVPDEHLPWLLPQDVDVTPTGEPPLAKSLELRERTEKIFGKGWTPEVETMDTFVDSSWYYLRYTDPTNEHEFAAEDKQQEWMPIDIYFGGSEHTTMHLLYSRFVQKVLFDLRHSPFSEPYKLRINRGLVLGPDGNKMSKSKGNVIDPDEQVGRLGADTVKMYLAFMGPYGTPTNYPWDMGGIVGIRRFLERVVALSENLSDSAPSRALHATIHKVTSDIANFKFNTAISALMIFLNGVEKSGLSKDDFETFLRLLAPFAPHLTEELWESLGHSDSIHQAPWPIADETQLKADTVTIAIQINGKTRGTLDVSSGLSEDDAVALAKADPALAERLAKIDIAKVIWVQDRLLGIVGKEKSSS